jgi:hypothetical protein
VRPHLGRQGGRQRGEGDALKPVEEGDVRLHLVHHRL